MATTQHVVFEHSVRDAIREQINRFDREVAIIGQPNLSVSINYDHSRSDGMWKLYTYYNGIGLDTAGAILFDTMTRHLNQICSQMDANKLPSLIAGPSSSVPMSEDI